MIQFTCPYGGPDHEFPDDWKFSVIGDDWNPQADPRWLPTHYQFLDSLAGFSHMSGQFRCDDEAIDYFTAVAKSDPDVKFIAVKRPGDSKFSMMPFVYVVDTDTVHPHAWKAEE